jgi:DnaJ-class molecular chaperone
MSERKIVICPICLGSGVLTNIVSESISCLTCNGNGRVVEISLTIQEPLEINNPYRTDITLKKITHGNNS